MLSLSWFSWVWFAHAGWRHGYMRLTSPHKYSFQVSCFLVLIHYLQKIQSEWLEFPWGGDFRNKSHFTKIKKQTNPTRLPNNDLALRQLLGHSQTEKKSQQEHSYKTHVILFNNDLTLRELLGHFQTTLRTTARTFPPDSYHPVQQWSDSPGGRKEATQRKEATGRAPHYNNKHRYMNCKWYC